jgi:hypothetical protein
MIEDSHLEAGAFEKWDEATHVCRDATEWRWDRAQDQDVEVKGGLPVTWYLA